MFRVFAVFDAKAEEFGNLILARTDAVGVRMFTDAVMDGSAQNNFRRYPEDYSFVRVGEFNEETGQLVPCDPVEVVKAATIVAGVLPQEVLNVAGTKL